MRSQYRLISVNILKAKSISEVVRCLLNVASPTHAAYPATEAAKSDELAEIQSVAEGIFTSYRQIQ